MNTTDARLTRLEQKADAIEPQVEPIVDTVSDEEAVGRLFRFLAGQYCRERRSTGEPVTDDTLPSVLYEGMRDAYHWRTEEAATFWYVLLWGWPGSLVRKYYSEPTAEMRETFEKRWQEAWYAVPMREKPVNYEQVVEGLRTTPPIDRRDTPAPWWWAQFWQRAEVRNGR